MKAKLKKSILFLLMLLLASSIFAIDHSQSANYILLRGYFSSAGGSGNSTSFNLLSSFGQIGPAGKSESTYYYLYSGLFSEATSINPLTKPSVDVTPEEQRIENPTPPYQVAVSLTAWASDSKDHIFTYTWDFGDDSSQEVYPDVNAYSHSVTHTYTNIKEGPYVVTCTVKDPEDIESSDTANVYIGPQNPEVTIVASQTTGGSPMRVTLSADLKYPDPSQITNYEWDFGDGSATQSGETLNSVIHEYTVPVTGTTSVYTATLTVTDVNTRQDTDTETFTVYPAIFFDDFEDNDITDWTQYGTNPWSVINDNSDLVLATGLIDAGHTITAPIPGSTISYGRIVVEVKIPSSSTTTSKNALLVWSFISDTNFRYVKFDYDTQQVTFGVKDGLDQDISSFSATIPLGTYFTAEVIFRPGGTAVALFDGVEIGSYNYGSEKLGMVGLVTRKSQTYFNNFMVSKSTDVNIPPDVTVNPSFYVVTVFPTPIQFTVTATDPDGDDDALTYYWNFGDGSTSSVKEPLHSYLIEGIFVATLDVTDEGLGTSDPATTRKKSIILNGADFYDNFNDNDVSDWYIVPNIGTWFVSNGRLRSDSTNQNHIILSPYVSPQTGDTRMIHGTICTYFNIKPKVNNYNENAVILFAYNPTNEFHRFVRFDRDEGTLSIRHDDNVTAEITDAYIFYTPPLDKDIHACVAFENYETTKTKVTVYVDGESRLSYIYSTQATGRVGLRSGRSITEFDDFVIFDPGTTNSQNADIDSDDTVYDFGEVRTDDTNGATRDITIFNRGNVNLEISSIGLSNPAFSFVSAPSYPVIISPNNGSHVFTLKYLPSGLGMESCVMSINSNDFDEPTYNILLNGEGVDNYKPIVTYTVVPTTGAAPLIVNFSATATDPDGDSNNITYHWDFGDAGATSNNRMTSHTYENVTTYTATLTVTDEAGKTVVNEEIINVDYYIWIDDFEDGNISNWTTSETYWSAKYVSNNWWLNVDVPNSSTTSTILAPAEAAWKTTAIFEVDTYVISGSVLRIVWDYYNQNFNGFLEINYGSGAWVVGKMYQGDKTVLASGTTIISKNIIQHVKLNFANGFLTATVANKVLCTDLNYGSFISTNHGIYVYGVDARFDNYKVTFTGGTSLNDPPTVDITADPTTGFAPLTATFTSTANDPDGDNNLITYSWDFGDGAGTSTAKNPTYTYTAAGTFTATCKVTDSGIPARTATDTVTISVDPGNPPPVVTVSANPTAGQAPLTVSFTATATDTDYPLTYDWYFGDSTAHSSEQSPTHTYTALGNYTATLTVTDSGIPPASTIKYVPIEVNNIITLFFDDFNDGNFSDWNQVTTGWSLYQASAGEYRLLGRPSSTSAIIKILTPSSGIFGNKKTLQFDFMSRTDSLLTNRKFDLIFCFQDWSNHIKLSFNGKTGKLDLIRVANGVQTNLTSGTLYFYLDVWQTLLVDIQNNYLTVSKNGTNIINNYNLGTYCRDSVIGFAVYESSFYFDNVRIRGEAAGVNLPPTLDIAANPTTGSTPLTVTFTSTATDPDGDPNAITYNWNFGDSTANSTLKNPTHVYNTAGTFTVTCVATDAGTPPMTATDTVVLDIAQGNTPPTVTVTANPTAGPAPLTVNFTATATDPDTPLTYDWNFGDSSPHTDTVSVSHEYTATGNYTVTLTVTDSGSPAASTVKYVNIEVNNIVTLFFDDFNDGNFSDWTIVNNGWSLYQQTTGEYRLWGQPPTSTGTIMVFSPSNGQFGDDKTLEFDFLARSGQTLTNRKLQVIFSYQNINNYLYLDINGKTGKIDLVRLVNGSKSVLKTGTLYFNLDVWTHLIIDVQNGILNVSKTGASIITNYNLGTIVESSFGFAVMESSILFDNTRITGDASSFNVPPEVTVSANPTTGPSPLTVSFTSTATDSDLPLTYDWNFGDSSAHSSVASPEHTYTATGTYTATLTVTDSGTPPASTVKYVPIEVSNIVTLFFDDFNDGNFSDWNPGAYGWSLYLQSAGQYRLEGKPNNLTDYVNILSPTIALFGDNKTLDFDFYARTNGIFTGRKFDVVFGFQNWQNYYKLSINGKNGKLDLIRVVSGSATVLKSGTMYFYNDEWVHLAIDIQAGVMNVLKNDVNVFNYSIGTLTDTRFGFVVYESDVFFDNVRIRGPIAGSNVAPQVTISANPTTGNAPLTVSFTSTADDPDGDNNLITYNWNFGDGTTASVDANPTHTYTAGGTFTATCTVTDSGVPARTDTDQIVLSISPGNSAPTVTITANPTGGPAPLNVNFTANATDPDTPLIYEWDFGDGSPHATDATITHTYFSNSTYTVTLTVTDSGSPPASAIKNTTIEVSNIINLFFDDFNDGNFNDWNNVTGGWELYLQSGSEYRLSGVPRTSTEVIKILSPQNGIFGNNRTLDFNFFARSGSTLNKRKLQAIICFTDWKNYTVLDLNGATGKLDLIRVTNGVATTLTSATFYFYLDDWKHFAISLQNGLLTVMRDSDIVLINNYNLGTCADSVFGFTVTESRIFIDNVRVRGDASLVNQPPTIDISASPTSGTPPLTVTFASTANDPDGNNAEITYSWDFGDASGTSTAANPVYIYTTGGTYTATCIVTDSGTPPQSAADFIVIDIALSMMGIKNDEGFETDRDKIKVWEEDFTYDTTYNWRQFDQGWKIITGGSDDRVLSGDTEGKYDALTVLFPYEAEFEDGNTITFDFMIKRDRYTQAKDFCLLFDYKDKNNLSMIYFDGTRNTIKLFTLVDGIRKLLTQVSYDMKFDVWNHASLSLKKERLALRINDQSILNGFYLGSMSSPISGLMVLKSVVLFDNIAFLKE